jgi:hypothetical protein
VLSSIHGAVSRSWGKNKTRSATASRALASVGVLTSTFRLFVLDKQSRHNFVPLGTPPLTYDHRSPPTQTQSGAARDLGPNSGNLELHPRRVGGCGIRSDQLWYPESAQLVRQWWPILPSVPRFSCTVTMVLLVRNTTTHIRT